MHELSTRLLSKETIRSIYQGDSFVPALCSVDTEQQSMQSNRATEQSAAEQSAGHMTRALLLRVSPLRLTATSAPEAQSYLWALSHTALYFLFNLPQRYRTNQE